MVKKETQMQIYDLFIKILFNDNKSFVVDIKYILELSFFIYF